MATLATLKRNTSVTYGIECRYPYLDHRVVEFCVGLPPDQHRSDGWSRRLLRRAAERRIPAKIAWRPGKSPTFIDLMRGILKVEGELKTNFKRWRNNPLITTFVDLSRMGKHLQMLADRTDAQREDSTMDTGSFCRAILLASYLEGSGKSASLKD